MPPTRVGVLAVWIIAWRRRCWHLALQQLQRQVHAVASDLRFLADEGLHAAYRGYGPLNHPTRNHALDWLSLRLCRCKSHSDFVVAKGQPAC